MYYVSSDSTPPQGGHPTPQPAERTFRFGRGAFLALAGITGGAIFLGKRATGGGISFLPGSTSIGGFTIYTVTGGYPAFSAARYRLRIDGMVRNPITMSVDDILRHPAVTETRFYQCVTGWSVPNAKWTGIRLP